MTLRYVTKLRHSSSCAPCPTAKPDNARRHRPPRQYCSPASRATAHRQRPPSTPQHPPSHRRSHHGLSKQPRTQTRQRMDRPTPPRQPQHRYRNLTPPTCRQPPRPTTQHLLTTHPSHATVLECLNLPFRSRRHTVSGRALGDGPGPVRCLGRNYLISRSFVPMHLRSGISDTR